MDTSLTLDKKLMDEVYDEVHKLKINKYEAVEQALRMWLREVKKTGEVPRETMDAPGHLRADLEILRDAMIAVETLSANRSLQAFVRHIKFLIEQIRQEDHNGT